MIRRPIGISHTDKKTREAATEGFKRLVAVLAGKSKTQNARRRALLIVPSLAAEMA